MLSQRIADQGGAILPGAACGPVSSLQQFAIENDLNRYHVALLHIVLHIRRKLAPACVTSVTRPESPSQTAAIKRLMRSSVEGCVEKSRIRTLPVNGLMMNMCAVSGEAWIGMRFE
jgi:hypothetical protein